MELSVYIVLDWVRLKLQRSKQSVKRKNAKTMIIIIGEILIVKRISSVEGGRKGEGNFTRQTSEHLLFNDISYCS